MKGVGRVPRHARLLLRLRRPLRHPLRRLEAPPETPSEAPHKAPVSSSEQARQLRRLKAPNEKLRRPCLCWARERYDPGEAPLVADPQYLFLDPTENLYFRVLHLTH